MEGETEFGLRIRDCGLWTCLLPDVADFGFQKILAVAMVT